MHDASVSIYVFLNYVLIHGKATLCIATCFRQTHLAILLIDQFMLCAQIMLVAEVYMCAQLRCSYSYNVQILHRVFATLRLGCMGSTTTIAYE